MAAANGIASHAHGGSRERGSRERDYYAAASRSNNDHNYSQRYPEDQRRSHRSAAAIALSDSGAAMGYRGVYGGGSSGGSSGGGGGDSPAITVPSQQGCADLEGFDAVATFGYSAGSSAAPPPPPPPRPLASTSSPGVWAGPAELGQEQGRLRRSSSMETRAVEIAVGSKRQEEDRVAAAAVADSRWQSREAQEQRQRRGGERFELERRGRGGGGAENDAGTNQGRA